MSHRLDMMYVPSQAARGITADMNTEKIGQASESRNFPTILRTRRRCQKDRIQAKSQADTFEGSYHANTYHKNMHHDGMDISREESRIPHPRQRILLHDDSKVSTQSIKGVQNQASRRLLVHRQAIYVTYTIDGNKRGIE